MSVVCQQEWDSEQKRGWGSKGRRSWGGWLWGSFVTLRGGVSVEMHFVVGREYVLENAVYLPDGYIRILWNYLQSPFRYFILVFSISLMQGQTEENRAWRCVSCQSCFRGRSSSSCVPVFLYSVRGNYVRPTTLPTFPLTPPPQNTCFLALWLIQWWLRHSHCLALFPMSLWLHVFSKVP